MRNALRLAGAILAGIVALLSCHLGLIALSSSGGNPEAGSAAWIGVAILAFILMAIAVWIWFGASVVDIIKI